MQCATLKEEIIARLEYEKKYRLGGDYKNGFMRIESGECCEKCKMTNPRNPLQDLVGCCDPFQINCSCHIPFRKVAVDVRIYTLEEILELIERKKERKCSTNSN